MNSLIWLTRPLRTLMARTACVALLLCPLAGTAELHGQQKPMQYEVRVINVEIPVRVFDGDAFVDNLRMQDFEIYENGVLQNIEAAYFINNEGLKRKEEVGRTFAPDTTRYFYLFFVVYEYDPRIREAIGFFINNILRPEDRLFVVTPKTSYEMKAKTLATTPKEKIVDKLSGIVRKDILAGDAAYRSVLQDLKRMAGGRVKAIEDQMHDPQFDSEQGEDPEVFLQRFRADMDRLENLRTLDDAKLYDLAAYLKGKQGQKHVFLFYQKEVMPQIEKNTLSKWLQSPTMKIMVDELFGLYGRTAHIDMDRLKKTYADSSIAISFLYLTTNPSDIAPDQILERSWDVYETFASMAQATGGLTESSSNLKSLMEKASKASENYYLLYYSPKDRSADGAFRKIEVRVKAGVYRVSHLAGYFAK